MHGLCDDVFDQSVTLPMMSWTLDHGCSYGHGFISWEFIHCLLLISIFTWLWYPVIHTCYIWAQLFCLLWSSFAFMHDLSTTPFISSFLANCFYFNILTLYCWILHHLGLTLWLGMLCTVGTKLECSPPRENAMQVSMASREPVRRASVYIGLDGKCKETNDLYWFGPSCRVIAFTSSWRVAFCVGLIGMIVGVTRGCTVPLFI